MLQINFTKLDGDSVKTHIDKEPDICPICKYSVGPTRRLMHSTRASKQIEIVYSCPKKECNSLFISYFEFSIPRQIYIFKESKPTSIQTRTFDVTITNLSQGFVAVYNEALTAENLGLENISGMGYRKALEFLIKDYLIEKNPEKAEEIKKKMLGPCIKDYISDERIKLIAERAAWLGNDETHYERRWVDKDVTDLKVLIDITLHYISMEKLAIKYIDEMPR